MLVTDAEARQQTCPLITYCVNEVDIIHHNSAAINAHQNCKGADCKMAWRWGEWGKFPEFLPLRGYCGLAGKPE